MLSILGLKIGSYLLYECSCPQNITDTICDNKIRRVKSIDDLKCNTLGTQTAAVRSLLAQGVDLFAYFEGDMPLGMMWGHRGSCYVRGPGIPLIQNKDTVYWFWIFTSPEARGKNVYKKLKAVFFDYYKDARSFTALVEPKNSIMRREMDKLGFKITTQYYYIKLLNSSFFLDRSLDSNNFEFHIEVGNRYNLLLI